MAINRGEWNLTPLIKDKGEVGAKLKEIDRLVTKIEGARKILINDITPEEFLGILKDSERFAEAANRLGAYAYLKHAEDTQSDENSALLASITNKFAEFSNRLEFFDNWWEKGIDEKNANRLIKKAGDLAYYLSFEREMAVHTLSEGEEKLITKLSVTGAEALEKLYTIITERFEYPIKVAGKRKLLTREEISKFVTDENASLREAAYLALHKKFRENLAVTGEIYRNIVTEWKNIMDIRHYASPISMRNVANHLDDESVEILLKACREGMPLFRGLFKLKAEALGLKKLRQYDLFAPVRKLSQKGKRYSYEEAAKFVIDTWDGFSPQLAGYAKAVINGRHIDYGIRKGKRSGGFCTNAVDGLPYVQITYKNEVEDVITLGHELGHAMHGAVAASRHSILNRHEPLPLAETASIFSESLIFDRMAWELDKDSAKELLFKRVDEFYGAIGKQAAYTFFEIGAHEKLVSGAVLTDLNELWFNGFKTDIGDSVELSQDFEVGWAGIPHFFTAPFYCYAYAFGNLLALSFFERYKKEGNAFAKDYYEILAAGGSQGTKQMLANHGVDISDINFWRGGFTYIGDQIKALSNAMKG